MQSYEKYLRIATKTPQHAFTPPHLFSFCKVEVAKEVFCAKLFTRRATAVHKTANRGIGGASIILLGALGYSWGIRGVFVEYSWDIRMYRVCVGNVSGMYRECIERYGEGKMRKK